MKNFIIILTMLLFASPLHAKDSKILDTPENRVAQAERYLAASPPKEMMVDMVEKMSAQMSDEKRQIFNDLMIKNMDLDKITQIIHDSMVKYFTADELGALADFYSSRVGKSAMSKFGVYMADVMPKIQPVLVEAAQKTQDAIQN